MMLEHLLSVWPETAGRLTNTKIILLLADFDGTLTPIVERPELANLSTDMRALLQQLSRQHSIKLGIISGRALADLKEKVGIDGITYAGNHGLEIEGPGIIFVNPVADQLRPILRIMHYVLTQTLSSIKGVFVENKGLSLSVHYRLAEEHRGAEVEAKLKKAIGGVEAAGKAMVVNGKKVFDVRPVITWNKGKAIKLLMKKYGKGGRRSGLLPIYLGDDVTDEDGFKVIENYGMGLSIYVGDSDHQTAARYFLKSPQEVFLFLSKLSEFNQNRMYVRHMDFFKPPEDNNMYQIIQTEKTD
jgi:trehalose 6-phosphate phosphatase